MNVTKGKPVLSSDLSAFAALLMGCACLAGFRGLDAVWSLPELEGRYSITMPSRLTTIPLVIAGQTGALHIEARYNYET